MTLARVLLSIVATLAIHRSHTAPQPRPSDTKVDAAMLTLNERYFMWWIVTVKTLAWVACIIETMAFLTDKERVEIHATWECGLGTLLSVAGTLLRMWCFRILGQRFTFQLATHDSNRLITTGPYSLCRHPSYLAGSVCFFGTCGVFLTPGSATSLLLARGMRLEAVWVFCVVTFVPTLWARIAREEEMLAREFKEEWTAYCRTVRARLVPGIL
ncbi:hypothetical protein EXIGLDRAFT_841317 [Exidia glandulosa HHB12029]|uniref:Protein-S-isoprenylcysteine O-methyltransferase n=1 Tax=Exidia glandulosa HHB12029 TaxID=1314781 RepID=A0A165DYT2_EXIGL|nr:hypothetical protein EXIGLDRAFT_841317 [Exidia glandulosa HHB12029]